MILSALNGLNARLGVFVRWEARNGIYLLTHHIQQPIGGILIMTENLKAAKTVLRLDTLAGRNGT